MDWGSTIANIVLSLSVTVFGYLLVPIIVILKGNKYDAKKLKRINRINCIIVWILFRIIRTAINGEPGTGAAVFLWGAVGQHLLNKYCLEETTKDCADSITSSNLSLSVEGEKPLSPNFNTLPVANRYVVSKSELPQINETPQNTPHKVKPTQVQPNQPPAPSQRRIKYCSRCGKLIDPDTKKCQGCGKQYFKGISIKKGAPLILLFLATASMVCCLCLFIRIDLQEEQIMEQKKEIVLYKKDISDLEEQVKELEEDKNTWYNYWKRNYQKVNFIDESVVFIENDRSSLYHKYECDGFVGKDYWVHNIEYAKYLGFRPCSKCIN